MTEPAKPMNHDEIESGGDAPFAEAIRILERHWYTPVELAQWLNAPHPQLEGKSAVQTLAEGRAADVLAMVQRLDDGVYL